MEPDDERIRQRAYALWLEEGSPEGRSEEHWERARRLISEEEATTRQSGNEKSAVGKTAPKKS